MTDLATVRGERRRRAGRRAPLRCHALPPFGLPSACRRHAGRPQAPSHLKQRPLASQHVSATRAAPQVSWRVCLRRAPAVGPKRNDDSGDGRGACRRHAPASTGLARRRGVADAPSSCCSAVHSCRCGRILCSLFVLAVLSLCTCRFASAGRVLPGAFRASWGGSSQGPPPGPDRPGRPRRGDLLGMRPRPQSDAMRRPYIARCGREARVSRHARNGDQRKPPVWRYAFFRALARLRLRGGLHTMPSSFRPSGSRKNTA